MPYIPPDETTQLEELVTKIHTAQKNNTEQLVLMGDLKAKSLEWNNQKTNKAGEIMEGLLNTSNLLCVNDGQPTRRNTTSVIDLVLVTPNIKDKLKECTTLSHENIRSDHVCLLTELDVCQTDNANRPKRKIWQLNKVDWNTWRDEADTSMGIWLQTCPSSNDVEVIYQSFKEVIDKTMRDVISQREMKERKNTRPPWWNADVNSAKKNLNYKQRQYKKRNIQQNKEA